MEIKNCFTCAHKKGAKCLVGGRYYEIEREYKSNCNIDFDKWFPKLKRRGIFKYVKALFYGEE